MATAILCFVCHNDETVAKCLKDNSDCFVLFVGNNPTTILDSRVIVLRDLEHNIEGQSTLSTFTAWYAVIKNNLFEQFSHICILENDFLPSQGFIESVNAEVAKNADCISFLKIQDGLYFGSVIDLKQCNMFLNHKGLQPVSPNLTWYPTINHCIKREKLATFVDWFYPDCLYFLNGPSLSLYHERLFSVWLSQQELSVTVLNNQLQHLSRNIHSSIQPIQVEPQPPIRHMRNRLLRLNRQRHPQPPPQPEPQPQPQQPTYVVFAFAQLSKHPSSPSTFWGLGDMLRGLLSVYQYCKQFRYEFRLGLAGHPILNYLDISADYVLGIPPSIKISYVGGDGGRSLQQSDLQINTPIFSNVWCKEPLLNDERKLIKTVLNVSTPYKIILPAKYNLFHFRLNDVIYNSGKKVDTSNFNSWLRLIQNNYTPGDFLISNCKEFKIYIRDQLPGINLWNEDGGVHSGFAKDNSDLLPNIYDLQITTNASRIYTYSEYSWISGFVYWPALAYQIPLVDLKMVKI
jgi:hypothetical protein